jgi:glycosyltransferase involved in cell wall biosynthesis
VYTPHAYAFLTQEGFLRRRIYRFGERALLPWTDKVVAVSNSEGRATLGLSGTGRIEVIPNGVNARLPSPQKAGRRPFRIGWLGRLVWQKDPESAVRVSFVLATLGIEHELLLGGEGVDRERVERALQECRATRWVRMPGFVRDTEAFHAAIDVLLMTSRSEGLPYVGLDAMAHGVPIVGFDVPGIQDLVEHGVTGLLASRGDPGGLAAHLARLARDEDLRKRLGAAARLRVLTQFQFEKQIDRLCELYQSLASNCPSVGLPARAPA